MEEITQNNGQSVLTSQSEEPPSRKRPRKRFSLRPPQYIVLGFLAIILAGALLLCLPISSTSGRFMNFLTALFTSTSAVCVTGLTVLSPAVDLNGFGQAVLLLLIQMGGLGFMTLSTMMMVILKRRITLKERIAISEALDQGATKGVVKLTIHITLLTLIIEGAGMILLLPYLVYANGAIGIWQALFTSVSSFCNAGFDIFGSAAAPFPSMTGYVNNVVICLTVCFLIIVGGMGFTVITDLIRSKFRFRRLSLHSKIVLVMTGILLLLGFLAFLCTEYNEALASLGGGGKVLAAFFQSVTTRTAGFNTVDQSALSPAGKIISMALMFVGASPASTGGGIKTSSLAILVMMVIAGLRGRDDVVLFKKSISYKRCLKAVSLVVLSLALVLTLSMVLMFTEKNTMPPELYNMENIMFEAFSAFGTVGLSTGVTPHLSGAGQVAVMIVMFFGRVGPITIGTLFISRRGRYNISYPEGNILLG